MFCGFHFQLIIIQWKQTPSLLNTWSESTLTAPSATKEGSTDGWISWQTQIQFLIFGGEQFLFSVRTAVKLPLMWKLWSHGRRQTNRADDTPPPKHLPASLYLDTSRETFYCTKQGIWESSHMYVCVFFKNIQLWNLQAGVKQLSSGCHCLVQSAGGGGLSSSFFIWHLVSQMTERQLIRLGKGRVKLSSFLRLWRLQPRCIFENVKLLKCPPIFCCFVLLFLFRGFSLKLTRISKSCKKTWVYLCLSSFFYFTRLHSQISCCC